MHRRWWFVADQQSNSMFVFRFQRGEQAPRLVPRAERNRKLSYWKNKDSCAHRRRGHTYVLRKEIKRKIYVDGL